MSCNGRLFLLVVVESMSACIPSGIAGARGTGTFNEAVTSRTTCNASASCTPTTYLVKLRPFRRRRQSASDPSSRKIRGDVRTVQLPSVKLCRWGASWGLSGLSLDTGLFSTSACNATGCSESFSNEPRPICDSRMCVR